MRKSLWVCLGLSLFAAVGCNVEVHERYDDDGWDDWGHHDEGETLDERAEGACDDYCVGLVECGAIGDGAFLSCREMCEESYKDDESKVSAGCTCVLEAQCSASAASSCEGDPLPGVWLEDGDSSPDLGAGGADNGSGADPDPGNEPPTGDPCVASCQCDEGMACIEGACAEPPEPVVECDNDCDCTSGESCVEGSCQ